MRWVAPSEKDAENELLEKRLWAAADQFRAESAWNIERRGSYRVLSNVTTLSPEVER